MRMIAPAHSLQHYLQPVLMPGSVALVGASDRPGTLGRIVLENALAVDFDGELFAVNPSHRTVLGRKCYPDLASIGAPIDLAVIVTPPAAIARIFEDAAKSGVRGAVVMTDPPPGDLAAQLRWSRELAAIANRANIRMVGPGAFGVIRTDLGLNVSVTDVQVTRGRLALVAQSGAVATAMLDFATPLGIGFSTVVSLGAGIDVKFGEMLDGLLVDPETDGILLYVESIRDARRFLSALRAAARTKPVIVLKGGRSATQPQGEKHAPPADAVFDAAIRRAGTVRVHTYTQLFAAARILAMGRIPGGDRLGIVANGRGPAVLAADSAVERGVQLATLAPKTLETLEALVPGAGVQGNPVDVHGNAAPEQFADAVAALLADPGVDAIVALHVPRPGTAATDAARTVATVSRGADKPVLGAWLGAIDRHEAREALEAGGIANFFTPENAVEAFSFLAAYHRHQEWLLEVPPPQPEPEPPDLAAAEAVRAELGRAGEVELTDEHASRLLAAFGIATPPRARAATLEGVKQAARKLGYPVSLVLERNAPGTPRRERLRDARAVAHAYAALAGQAGDGSKRKDDVAVVLRKEPREDAHRDLSIGLYTDSLFGPVLAFGPRGAGERTLMLPPLNRRLAGDLVDGPRGRHAGARLLVGDEREAVIRLLLKLSTLACALPWVVEVELDPLAVIEGEVIASGVRIVADRRRAGIAGYAHMAIHPYPAELASEFVARNGVHVHIRPILPEDAQREQRFVAGLSEQTRFFRFFYRMHQLTPAMLARFTQVDYDREMALVALVDDADGVEGLSFVAVARYIENPDGISAEYAVVVADAWQAQGVGRALMERLIAVARRNGLRRLEGAVLKENVNMLKFVAGLGFSTRNDPQDGDEVITYLELA